MFSSIINALLGGWFLSLFGIDEMVIDFMRNTLDLKTADTSSYYVACIFIGILSYVLSRR